MLIHSWPRAPHVVCSRSGWGVRALQTISPGAFIIEYVGEVIDDAELSARMRTASATGQHSYYIMELGQGLYVDARTKGNMARLLNSSCQPNCETQKWTDAATGEQRIGIFAKREIAPGEVCCRFLPRGSAGKRSQHNVSVARLLFHSVCVQCSVPYMCQCDKNQWWWWWWWWWWWLVTWAVTPA
jgi:hypothetical protein